MAYACVSVCVYASVCVCNFVSAAETVADMFALAGAYRLRLATGIGIGMGLGFWVLGTGYWVLGTGPPAATHPHLLSLTMSHTTFFTLCPRSLAATSAPAAWQSEYQFPVL